MSQYDPAMSRKRVRSAALWPAIAAALMLYFAYSGGGWIVRGEGAFRIGGQLFVHTLEIGGWAMAAAALWLLAGMRPALFFDAVAVVIIGALLIVSGGLMISGGGLQPILNIIFGVMFIGSGRQNWREYRLLSGDRADRAADEYDPDFEQRYAAAQDEQAGGSLPGRLMQRSRDRAQTPAESVPPTEPATAGPAVVSPLPSPPTPQTPPDPAPEPRQPPAPKSAPSQAANEQPAPDGFLAQFADDKDPPDEPA